MKRDIRNREDIVIFFHIFYDDILKDEQLSPFFEKMVADGKMDEHINTMSDFLDNILFFSGKYKGNPMERHAVISLMTRLKVTHFSSWKNHFIQNIDKLFAGKKATLAKERAVSISDVMEKRII